LREGREESLEVVAEFAQEGSRLKKGISKLFEDGRRQVELVRRSEADVPALRSRPPAIGGVARSTVGRVVGIAPFRHSALGGVVCLAIGGVEGRIGLLAVGGEARVQPLPVATPVLVRAGAPGGVPPATPSAERRGPSRAAASGATCSVWWQRLRV
jgi:hypothetical protein